MLRGFDSDTGIEWASQGLIDIDLGADSAVDRLSFSGGVDGLVVKNFLPQTDERIDVLNPSDWMISDSTLESIRFAHTNGEHEIDIELHEDGSTEGLTLDVNDWLQ